MAAESDQGEGVPGTPTAQGRFPDKNRTQLRGVGADRVGIADSESLCRRPDRVDTGATGRPAEGGVRSRVPDGTLHFRKEWTHDPEARTGT